MNLHGFVCHAIRHFARIQFRAANKDQAATARGAPAFLARFDVAHMGRLIRQHRAPPRFPSACPPASTESPDTRAIGFPNARALLRVAHRRLERALRQSHRLRRDTDRARRRALRARSSIPALLRPSGSPPARGNPRKQFRPYARDACPSFLRSGSCEIPETSLHKKRGHAARARRRIRLRKHDVDAGNTAVRDPALRAVQHVVIAVAHRPRLNPAGIRSRLRLGQAKRANNFAARKPRKIFLLLRLGAMLQRQARRDTVFVTLTTTAVEASTRATSSIITA